jgi:chitin-binding protein
MIVAAWDVYDTGSTFYNMIDLNVTSGGGSTTPEVCDAPTGLSTSNTTQTSTTLSWNKNSNCNNYESTYKVYQNNSVITTTTSTTFTVQNLAPNTTYSFMVEDMSTGKKSNAVSVTTLADSTPQPEACKSPLGLHSMGTTKNTVSLMWNMSGDCMDYTSSYEVYQNGYYLGTTNTTSYNVTGLTPSTTYSFYVKDTKNGQVSNTFTVTTSADENQGGGSSETYPDLVIGQTYYKGDLVTHDGETKEVIQTFTYYGDPNWWNAPSLFKNI